MISMIGEDENGHPYLIHQALVDNYLKENLIVMCKGIYYLYDFDTGVWEAKKDIEAIQIDTARFMKKHTNLDWKVGYKKDIIEKLKVEIQEIKEMDVAPSTMVCLLNGVYDMATGEFGEFEPAYYFTSHLQVNYDPNAKCKLFSKFLREISCRNRLRRKSLEEFLGISLVRDVGGGQAFIMWGHGANGKSVYMKIACALAGIDRWTTVSLKEMPNFGTVVLRGKTLAVISEIDKQTSNSLMTKELKQALTSEYMSCNEKNKPITTIRPFASFLILSNFQIGLLFDDTEGALRRLHILPCEMYLSENERDNGLEDKLMEELDGIFLLAAEGYRRLCSNNYQYSSKNESDSILREILRSENPLRSFVKEKIEYSYGSNMLFRSLNESYKEWCIQNGIEFTQVDSKALYREISKQYNVSRHKSGSDRGIKHIKIKE